jgi:hypothetical protein
MINYQNIQVTNLYTEGFEVTFPSPMTISFGPGKVVNTDIPVEYVFDEIEFDVEADPELNVSYDVYLLMDKDDSGLNIQVDRTEIGLTSLSVYEGEAPLLHCLLSLFVPAGTTSVDDLSINVRNVKQTPKEASTDEV